MYSTYISDRSYRKPLWPSGRVLITPPAIEPLTVQEVQTQLRLDSSNQEPVPAAPSVAMAGQGTGLVTNGVHRYCVTFVTSVGETSSGVITGQLNVVNNAVDGKVNITNIPLGGSQVTARKIYRTLAGGTTLFLLTTLNDNTTTTFLDNVADGSLGAQAPAANTTADPEISGWITSARLLAEKELNRALITQQWKFYYDELPDNDTVQIYIPRPNLLSVDAFKYMQLGDGSLVDVPSTVYFTDTASLPGRIIKKFAQIWPILYPQLQNVQISTTNGYGPARSDVPQPIKDGMKMLIAGFYRNRVAYGTEDMKLSPVVMRLWETFRYKEF